MGYQKSFDSDLIGWSVRPEIRADRPGSPPNVKLPREFASDRLVESLRTHNQSCTPVHGLSMGIHFVDLISEIDAVN